APRQPAVEVTPAAQIDARYKQQRNDDPGIKRPRLKEGGDHRIMNGCVYFKLWSVAHKLADRNTGMMHLRCSIPIFPCSNIPFCVLSSSSSQPPGVAGTAESRAAGTFAGRNVCMKATRAVTSCGARFLPNAGMLPPP